MFYCTQNFPYAQMDNLVIEKILKNKPYKWLYGLVIFFSTYGCYVSNNPEVIF